MGCSPPVSSVHGILHARILEWVASSSSRGSRLPRDLAALPALPALQADSLPTEPPGKPFIFYFLFPSPLPSFLPFIRATSF